MVFEDSVVTKLWTGGEWLEGPVVLPDGEMVQIGGVELDAPGYDLLGAFVGSEGTLGIATEVTLRLVRLPETQLVDEVGEMLDLAWLGFSSGRQIQSVFPCT